MATTKRPRETVTPVTVTTAPVAAENPEIPAPMTRRLRIFALDPALGQRLQTERLKETTLEVPWEKNLQPGPVGEYLEIVDVDPSADACYAPVDLNHPHLLASDGHSPSEGVPQFHQQMVYAVAMTTIGRFEQALGRSALWAPRIVKEQDGTYRSYDVQRLRIYPHALREANAFYSPPRNALLFGYFRANLRNAGDSLPGGMVFTCLSHDVVAHETTHALVDGLHRYYQIQSNDDIAAFHEAFADIVALFQHFSMPAALRHVIAETRGDLAQGNALAQLAQQFGQATKGSAALRSALTEDVSVNDYDNATEAHARGAVLLGAIFQGFLEIYTARVADLKRLATGGTGVLPDGAISVDLVERMAREAAGAASHVLTTCIRALDYCPPIDVTFGDYLRALVTADFDVDREDTLNYRTAIISGFRARGIRPSGVRNFSEESLRWQPPVLHVRPEQIRDMLSKLNLSWNLATGRRKAHEIGEENGARLWQWMRGLTTSEASALGEELGLYLTAESVENDRARLKNVEIPMKGGFPVVQIHSVRPARRVNRRGQQSTDLVVEAVQQFTYTDPDTKEKTTHRGGCTLLIDVENERIRYAIRKSVGSAARVQSELRQAMGMAEDSQAYFDTAKTREPFAMLHRGE